MNEADLLEIEADHMSVTASDVRGRAYQACPTCPQIPGVGLVMHPCPVRKLIEEVRKLSGWVEFMEDRLLRYDEYWERESLP